MKAVTTPHDRLFHRVLGEKQNAVEFFKRALPARLVENVDWSTLKPLPQKVVEEALGKGRLDLVFSVQLAGHEALLSIIWEHQSTVDYWAGWRLGKYIFLLGEWWRGQHEDCMKVPLVVPVVLYHGRQPWTAPRSLIELIDVPPELGDEVAGFIPNFTYLLEDVTQRTDEEIVTLWRASMVQLVLRLFRHVFVTEFGRKAVEILRTTAENLDLPEQLQELWPVIAYILEVVEDFEEQDLRKLETALGPHAEGFVMTLAEQLREEGRQEGLEKGRIEKAAQAVLEVFEVRNLPVSPDIRDRITACNDVVLLNRWHRRAVIAESATEIFDV